MAYHSIYGKKLGVDESGNLVVAGGVKNSGDTPITMYPKLKTYTVATAPSASTAGAGAIIYVSDGVAGNPTIAVSDGTNWKSNAGTTIASS
jgi:hypothetical protein